MVPIVVDSRVWFPLDRLEGGVAHPVAKAVMAAFTHPNPAHRDDPKNEPAFDRTWRIDGPVLSVPRGGMRRVREAFAASGVRYVVHDRREPGLAMQVPHLRKLWPHQEKIVEAICARQNCLIRAGTGTGKTDSALAAACRLGRWTIAVVWTNGLLKQWRDRAIEVCGLQERDVGIVQGNVRRLRPLTIAMQKTLASRPLEPHELAMFGTLVCDEVQFFAAETFFASADPFPAKYRIGVSADETRRDGREYLIYDLFGDVASEFSNDEAVEAGVVHEVQVAVVPTGWSPGPYYHDAMISRNVFRIRWAQRKLQEEIATSGPRADLAAKLAADEAREGHTVAMLAARVEHCGLLANRVVGLGFPPGMMIGGRENEREFDDSARKVRAGSLRAVVGTVQAIGTGIDVPAFDRGVLCSHVTNNEQLFKQIRGRFCRKGAGKDGARLYVLWDRGVQGLKAVENLCRWNRDVVVLDEGPWVPGKEYLARHRGRGRTNIRRRVTHD